MRFQKEFTFETGWVDSVSPPSEQTDERVTL